MYVNIVSRGHTDVVTGWFVTYVVFVVGSVQVDAIPAGWEEDLCPETNTWLGRKAGEFLGCVLL
jgi:hypothetical protein